MDSIAINHDGVALVVCGGRGSVLVVVLFFSTLCPSFPIILMDKRELFCNHIDEEERADCVVLIDF